jgi:cyclopropane fatty-acyl-phospholipid synthase-like methyltransferase
MPLSKWQKLQAGGYLVLQDYANGLFPPTFNDQQQAYLNEINAAFHLPGTNLQELDRGEMAKPFWFGRSLTNYMRSFLKLAGALEQAGLRPPAKLLELGGGFGWTAEFLAQLGFRVVSTTISPRAVEVAHKRAEALRVKDLHAELQFIACPMESVADSVKEHCPFDAVFVFEALHHAFDWRAAITSSFACLRPGGWLMLCDEPNVLHTAISYRVSRLSNTHEIGFSKGELVRHLKHTGFGNIVSLGKRPHLFVRAHWLVAQKL